MEASYKRMRMIKAVLFDIDDTLLSFQGCVKESMKEGFGHFHLKEYKEWMYETFTKINDDLWRQIETGALTFEELKRIRWSMVFNEIGIDFDGPTFEKYFRDKLYDSAILEDGAIEILEYLRDRYVLCAVSNGPYNQQLNRLKISGLDKYFSYVFISGQVGFQKPTKEFFDYCFKNINENEVNNVKPDDSIIIGDSITADIKGGKSYGLETCLYVKNKNKRLEISVADHEISNLAEIRNFL